MHLLLAIALLTAPVTKRSDPNYVDVCDAGSCTRTIQGDINYEDHTGAWAATDQQIEVTTPAQTPDAWEGLGFSFDRKIVRGPVQVWFADTTTSGDDARTNIAFRDTKHRERWLQMRHIGALPGISCAVNGGRRGYECQNVWTASHIGYYLKRRGYRAVIRADDNTAPTAYDRYLRVPTAASIELRANGDLIIVAGGTDHMRVAKPSCWDSADGGDYSGRGLGGKYIDADWSIINDVQDASGHRYRVRLTIDSGDVPGSTWPIYCE